MLLHIGMLSDKHPVIIGIPPHPSSEESRGLLVFASGRDNYNGRKRRIGDDVVSEDIETARNERQAAGAEVPKSRPATQSRASMAAAKVARARPSPPRDSKAQLFSDDLIRESHLVFPSKTRGRAARKAITTIWSSDDEVEADDDGPGFNTSKRKQQDDAHDMASDHQSKQARSMPRWTSITDVDTLEGNTFNRASAHGKGDNASVFSEGRTADQLSISQPKMGRQMGGLLFPLPRGITHSTVRAL